MKRFKLTNGISSVTIKAKNEAEAKLKLKALSLTASKYKLIEVK
jgi:hypothetical protein